MTEQTQELIEQALLSSASAEQPLEQVDSAFSALLSQSQQSTPPILSQSDSSHLWQVLKTEL